MELSPLPIGYALALDLPENYQHSVYLMTLCGYPRIYSHDHVRSSYMVMTNEIIEGSRYMQITIYQEPMFDKLFQFTEIEHLNTPTPIINKIV